MKFTFAPETTPLPGYTIKRAIDRGGFGEVYYALTDSGKEVALKLLQRNQQVELRGVRQCLNLKHPNLVTIFDIKTDAEDDHWVVMEFMSGKSLEQVLAENPRGLPLDEVEIWLAGIATGTAFLHDRGIVHRDLKPANVFREGGIVKIGDVGLSKFITPSRRSAQTESVGTVYYMAPEVARGKYGSELDVYSLGVMLYEMLTGSVPFSGESTGEILMKHLTEPPDLNKLPAQYRQLVGQALEKDPHRRTAGAALLYENFRNVRQGKQIAVEIPDSHFVDVPKLERSPLLKPALAGRQGPPHSPTETFPHRGAAPGNAQPESRVDRNGAAVPVAETGFDYFMRQLGDLFNKHSGIAGIAMLLLILAAVRGARHMPMPAELVVIGGIGIAVFSAVKAAKKSKARAAAAVAAGEAVERRAAYQKPLLPVIEPPPAPRPKREAQPVAKKPAIPDPSTIRSITRTRTILELTGGMVMAVVWSILATQGVSWLSTRVPFLMPEQQLLNNIGGMATFGFGTVLGSWALLLSTKVLEGTGIAGRERRIIQAALGGAVGAIIFVLSQDLLLEFPLRTNFPHAVDHLGSISLTTTSSLRQPSLAGFIVYFALLFGVRRWWLLADSYRSKRFRIVSVAFTGGLALLIPALVVFHQTWGALWGTAIAVVVQLSAPWVAPKDRPTITAA